MSQQNDSREQQQGISNRESAMEEERERQERPPLDVGPPPEDAAEGLGEPPLDDIAGQQTSRKSGVRSSAQKQEESRDPERPTPPSRKVSGAFGKDHE